jgi:hypothetical protein
MKNMSNIRSQFIEKFNQSNDFSKNNDVNEWGKIPFDEDTTVINFKSDSLMKVMMINESSDKEILKFSYFLAKTGEKYEYNLLSIELNNSDQNVDKIFSIYKLWFIDNKSPDEMEIILEKY